MNTETLSGDGGFLKTLSLIGARYNHRNHPAQYSSSEYGPESFGPELMAEGLTVESLKAKGLSTGCERSERSSLKKQEGNNMENKQEQWVCANCGHTADSKFTGDICPKCGLTYWKCGKCGFLITAATPPDLCPQCKERCDFQNVTCYTPDCGGPGNIDPRL